MRAAVLDGPGPPAALVIRYIPVPEPVAGGVLIRVQPFGLNRSELHTRLGLAQRRSADRLRRGSGRPPPPPLQGFLDGVAAGTAVMPIGRVYRFDQIVQARADTEANRVSGKLVMLT